MKHILIAAALALASGLAAAQATPVGLWKTIDDETGKEKSLVRVTEDKGVFSGRIEKLLMPPSNPNCVKCEDERKGQPLEGLTILRNIKAGDEAGTWGGGDILDPKNGKVYKVRLKTLEGGKKLEVRGYVGAPVFGRSQTWQRAE